MLIALSTHVCIVNLYSNHIKLKIIAWDKNKNHNNIIYKSMAAAFIYFPIIYFIVECRSH
jgi:hypothetical protein